jgi:hypothetical protein
MQYSFKCDDERKQAVNTVKLVCKTTTNYHCIDYSVWLDQNLPHSRLRKINLTDHCLNQFPECRLQPTAVVC